MCASLFKVCLSPSYTMPTKTLRYYPGYPYIKYLPKYSIIATSPNLWYTTLACPRPNIFHQLIILYMYSTHHLKSYPTDPTYIYATILPTLRIQPTSNKKHHTRVILRSGTISAFFLQCGTVFYLMLYGAVRCIHVVTPVLSVDL